MHILDFNHVLGFSSLRGVPGFGILQRDPLTSMSVSITGLAVKSVELCKRVFFPSAVSNQKSLAVVKPTSPANRAVPNRAQIRF